MGWRTHDVEFFATVYHWNISCLLIFAAVTRPRIPILLSPDSDQGRA
jgi:hypothetical protein